MRTFLKYGAGLIALYLGVAYATGLGKDISAGTNGAATVVKAFQARS